MKFIWIEHGQEFWHIQKDAKMRTNETPFAHDKNVLNEKYPCIPIHFLLFRFLDFHFSIRFFTIHFSKLFWSLFKSRYIFGNVNWTAAQQQKLEMTGVRYIVWTRYLKKEDMLNTTHRWDCVSYQEIYLFFHIAQKNFHIWQSFKKIDVAKFVFIRFAHLVFVAATAIILRIVCVQIKGAPAKKWV